MKILFLQEYVRENHMKILDNGTLKNVFFSTKAGKILKKLAEEGLELKRNEYYVDYAYSLVPKVLVRDKYGKAVKYKAPKQSEANAEYPYLYQRIIKEKPDIIIPTGNLGCKALIGKSAITQLRGVPEKVTVTVNKGTDMEEHFDTWVLPMFSIEYMLMNPSVQNLIEADFVTLKKFVDEGESAFQASQVEYEFVTSMDRVREIFTKEIPNAPVTAWDLETNTLRPELLGAKPLVISLSWKEGTGATIPLEHKEAKWSSEEVSEIYQYIREFVGNPDIIKVGHNIQFDIRFLRLTKGFTKFANNRDTKVMYYLLVNQEVESSLKLSDLAYELTDMGGYDKPLEDFKKQFVKDYIAKEKERIKKLKEEHKKKVEQEKRKAKEEGRKYVAKKVKFPKAQAPKNEIDGGDFNYEWIPLKEILHPYASGDTDACLRIYNKLDAIGKKPENAKLRKQYTGHYPNLTSVLAKIEANGLPMDMEYNEELTEAYAEEEERLVEEMRKFPEVQQLEAEYRTLYERGLAEWVLPKGDRDEDIAKLRDKYKDKLKFNPNSSDDKQRVLFNIMGVTLPYNREYLVDSAVENNIPEDEIEWYHYKTNKIALEYIKKNFDHASDLCELLLTHSLVKTRKQGFTYKLRDMVDSNGFLHGGFNLTGTACVSGDTLLVTNQGIQYIEDLSDNRKEGTFSDVDINIHSHKQIEKADGFYYSGYRKGKKITLMDGTEILTTPEHPLLKNTYLSQRNHFNKGNKVFKQHLKKVDWEKAENIREGDYIALKIGTELYGNKEDIQWDELKYQPTATSHTKQATIPTKVTEELAEWLGMYMADGNIDESNKSVNFMLTNSDKEVRDRFKYLTKKIFNIEPVEQFPKDRSPKVTMVSAHVGRWIKEVLGVKTGAHNKDVPDIILQGTKKVQQAFIRGLTLDSAVHKKKYPSLYLCSVSKPMMDKVRVMLLNMGIYCSKFTRKSYADNRLDVHEVMITYDHLEKFMDEIGVIESRKRKILEDKLQAYKGRKVRRLGVIVSDEYVFVKVKSVEDEDNEFFDLHVPENHSFVGNGVVNHNTSRLSSQNPNLQQLPKKTGDVTRFDYKYPIKRMFTTRFPNGALIQFDYSSLESRVLALAARDEEMTQAFLDGADIHRETASLVFGVPKDEVTDDQRSDAKSTTFGKKHCRLVS